MKRIRQIRVEKLFGIFDHTIPLNLNERITIIHSPNGFGKTIMLKLLSEIFSQLDLTQTLSQKHAALRTVPFKDFSVDFDNGSSFGVRRIIQSGLGYTPGNTAIDEGEEITLHELKFHTVDPNMQELSFPVMLNSPVHSSRSTTMEREQPTLFERSLWEFEGPSIETAIEPRDRGPVVKIREPDWLREKRKAIPVRFIEAQRLLNTTLFSRNIERGRRSAMVPTVTLYSEEIAKIIQATLAESSALSQSLDSTFPTRVFSPTVTQRSITEDEILNRLAELGKKRSHLTTLGLLDQTDGVTFPVDDQIDESRRIMLSVYIEDTEKKLKVFDEIASKIGLLTTIINKRFLYKKMSVVREKGFIFTTDDGINLSPTDLSSGEQHLLVLFYELLFKTAPNSLILVDEPELSLHIGWQTNFLKDLQEVTRIADLDVLLATHSPDIISNRWDLTVQLEGPAE